MGLKPRVSQHIHTGRRLPHAHTSYAILVFMLLLVGVVLMSITTRSSAESFGVAASVAAPAVTGAAAITKPAMNQHFTSTPIEVVGTCQTGTLVKLFDNAIFVGSAICVGKSSFSLQTDLYGGRNDLVLRQFNANNQPGPDSATVTVYSDLSDEAAAAIARNGGQLVLISSNQYKGSLTGDEISWPLEIHGGAGPYNISWDWGDGQVDTVTRPDAGAFSLRHTYTKKGTGFKSTFPITIRAIDANGQAAYLQLVTIVNSDKNPIIPASLESGTLIAWPLLILALLMVVSFWLGELREKAVLWRQARKARRESGSPSAFS